MITQTEKLLTGTWKSYKIAPQAGNISLGTLNTYLQFTFTSDRLLTIITTNKHEIKELAETRDWQINIENNKKYLEIKPLKLVYEIESAGENHMVLVNTKSQVKMYFAKDPIWSDLILTNTLID